MAERPERLELAFENDDHASGLLVGDEPVVDFTKCLLDYLGIADQRLVGARPRQAELALEPPARVQRQGDRRPHLPEARRRREQVR